MTMTTNLLRVFAGEQMETNLSIASGTVINYGDILVVSSGALVPASTAALWSTDEAGTQAVVHDAFYGIAAGYSRSGDTNPILFYKWLEADWIVPAASYTIGAFVGGSRDASNNYLLAQGVESVANVGLAVAKIVETKTPAAGNLSLRLYFASTMFGVGLQAAST